MERHCHELTERAGQLRLVHLGDHASELGHDLVRFHGAQGLHLRPHPAQQLVRVTRRERVLDLVALPHPRRPVQVLRLVRRDPGDRRGSADALGQQRRARERMRTAPGPAHRQEPFDPQMIGQRRDVGRSARHAATFVPARTPEPRPRVRHQPDPALGGGSVERFERHRGAGAAVMEDDQRAVWIALVDRSERPPVGQGHGEDAAQGLSRATR
jgi:hypothetical protein